MQQLASSIVVNLDSGLHTDRHGLNSAATKIHEAACSLMRALTAPKFASRVCSAVVEATTAVLKAITTPRNWTKDICRIAPQGHKVLIMLQNIDPVHQGGQMSDNSQVVYFHIQSFPSKL